MKTDRIGSFKDFAGVGRQEKSVNKYQVRQLDINGQLLQEDQVEGSSYNAALRQLKKVVDGAWRLEVCDEQGNKAGGVTVEYWRQKGGR